MKPLVLACATLAIVAAPQAAQACSIAPGPEPTQAQLDRWTRESYLRATAVVEVVAETGSNLERPGRMRVLRSYRGNIPVGTRLAVRAVSGSMCGHGDFQAGARGVILIDRTSQPFYFRGFVAVTELARLRAFGLMPPL